MKEIINQKYQELLDYFDPKHLKIDVKYESIKVSTSETNDNISDKIPYAKVRVTHLPSGKVTFGTIHTSQIDNAIEALEKLKQELI